MADFHQPRLVPTLHALYQADSRQTYMETLEARLEAYARTRHITLLLPCLFSELSNRAVLDNIVRQIKPVEYISSIVVAIGEADRPEDFYEAGRYFEQLQTPRRTIIPIWMDSPRVSSFLKSIEEKGIAIGVRGKGQAVWFSLGYIFADGQADMVAINDCDVVTYDRMLPFRLIEPVASPLNNYEFSKGYYARVSPTAKAMTGRVTRLFVAPFLTAVRGLSAVAQNDHLIRYFDYHRDFRYILAGECCFSTRLGRSLNIASDWGLEVSILSEVFNRTGLSNICQVDLGINYEHKHQILSENDDSSGLHRMVIDITKYYLSYMRAHGCLINDNLIETIRQSYHQTALKYVKIFSHDAAINDLAYDWVGEERMVDHFRDFIGTAWEESQRKQVQPQIPSWNRVLFSFPDIEQKLLRVVNEDRLVTD